MSFANAWGSAWGSSGSGSSETIIVDSFGLEISMEESIFEELQEFELNLELQEYTVTIEEGQLVFSENQTIILEVE